MKRELTWRHVFRRCLFAAIVWLASTAFAAEGIRLMTLEPGHFHAALFQKEMLPGISPRVHVYAPLGPDLLAHLTRVSQFNTRPENPTAWELEVHTGPNALDRMLAEHPGNVVVLSGNNRGKIDRIAAIVRAGLHTLADKPWIIDPADLPKLEAALETAEAKGVIAFDAMTQRYEVSCLLAKELVNDPAIFGTPLAGSPDDAAVRLESVHYLVKEVAGAPLLRPAWFFDLRQQGECLADAGPHLVDQVQWTLFPEQTLDFRRDIAVLRASRKPILLGRAQFQRVTAQADYPEFLKDAVWDNNLEYFANDSVTYRLRGIHVSLAARWEYEAPPGGKDTELAIFRGSKARIETRQGRDERFVPEVFVVPNSPADWGPARQALQTKIAALQTTWPETTLREETNRLHVVIPDRLRVGHEAHFALLTRQFLEYVRQPQSLPRWEKPNMLAKYFVTTKGLELARKEN